MGAGRAIVLVEYFFTDTRLLAFVVRPDFRQPEVISVAADIERLRAVIHEAAQIRVCGGRKRSPTRIWPRASSHCSPILLRKT
jgi:hypothetical protein